ncbi:S1 family peptidase [Streptomyces koyangensis]|uniref:Trypsin-like peptidase domain-containing protein n=1 Tax=Streptomyces koyangensis TaxID=188770 RepID=A0ABX7EEH9_9ACTN|nr:serine protease [Streptomyces koyangensis]QRF02589.1 trypsin-like peptidase domain-containing protein [Streptomyces koyangensis]
MKKALAGAVLAAALLGVSAAPAVAAPGPAAPAPAAVDLAGTVALSNCSGSVVRTPSASADDPALVLSNGHCLETGFPAPGEVLVDQPSSRSFTLLDGAGNGVGTLRAAKLAYGTMTDTDVSLYQLGESYAEIESAYGIEALELDAARPAEGAAITVASGYWKRTYNCSIDGFAHQLKEGSWTWKDSVRYTDACDTIGGTSGSPVIDDATGKVVAVNNTGNESGGRCTDNNPCEVDENGEVTVREGINYGQQTYTLVPCIGPGSEIDLGREGCAVPKP